MLAQKVRSLPTFQTFGNHHTPGHRHPPWTMPAFLDETMRQTDASCRKRRIRER
jgi:hypothetical protein